MTETDVTLVVRDATPAEFVTVSDLWHRAEQARTGVAVADDVVHRLSEDMHAAVTKPGAHLLVGVSDRLVVATIYGVPLRRKPATAQVAMLAVEPSRWGRGIGTQMLGALTGALRLGGCRQLRMNVDPANARARALYERQGWRHDGETEKVDTSDVPELVYRRRLAADDGQLTAG